MLYGLQKIYIKPFDVSHFGMMGTSPRTHMSGHTYHINISTKETTEEIKAL